MLLPNVDYQIQYIKFPTGSVREAVTQNEDNSYTIFIESTITREQQMKEFLHAMKHIIGDDFSKEEFVASLERQAHYP